MSTVSSSSVLKLLAAGLAVGVIAALLVAAGNPGNMGVCVACFVRDIAGAFGGARLGMGGVAYLRPEVLGIVLGALGAAALSREFRPRGGVAFAPRFLLGFVFMVSALVFLGCTVRVWLRIGGGDLNAVVGAAGLVAGVAAGAALVRAGYALPKARALSRVAGLAVPAVVVALLALAMTVAAGAMPGFLTVTAAPASVVPASATSAPAVTVTADPTAPGSAPKAPTPPGGKRAPLVLSLLAGLAVGVVAQRSRFCTTGPIRDLVLWRSPVKLVGLAGLVAGAAVANLAFGQFRLGLAGQPVAHTDVVANFAAMAVAGLAAVLMGGCPLRQLVMAGEGDADAGGALAGMVAGALFAHGAGVASSPKGPAGGALWVLASLAGVTLAFALWTRRRAAAVEEPVAEL
ncbi:MAG TPA: YedE family putative selenium transporter [Anaeromyxobacter sp.]|nr:YedE family putative selenium transporter [Anaeromyxobacter sp.]